MNQYLTNFYLQPLTGEHLRLNLATGEMCGALTGRVRNGEHVVYAIPSQDGRRSAETDTHTIPTVAEFLSQRGWADIKVDKEVLAMGSNANRERVKRGRA